MIALKGIVTLREMKENPMLTEDKISRKHKTKINVIH